MKILFIPYLNILLILFFLFPDVIYCQENLSEQNVKSPQVADMIRYGNIPVSMYAGRLDLEIPLTTIEDPDFIFPISLRYNSSGFMPIKDDGLVGLNWSLACGGVIVREVKGFPDDINYKYDSSSLYRLEGFLYFLKNKNKYNHSDIVSYPEMYIDVDPIMPVSTPRFYNKSYGLDGVYVEASSDIYHFNFNNHSGKFMINFDGSVNVLSNDGHHYDIDLSNYIPASFNGEPTASSMIITTDDGYKYIFGGSYDAMEYSLEWQNRYIGMNETRDFDGFREKFGSILPNDCLANITISSFFLTKIIAPSERVVEIVYKKLPSDFYDVRSLRMYNAIRAEAATAYKRLFSSTYTNSYHLSNASNDPDFKGSRTMSINHVLTKNAIIESIKTDNQIIQFYYSDKNIKKISTLPEFSGQPLLPLELQAGTKLVSLVHSANIKKNDPYTIFKSIDLSYTQWVGQSDRSLLETVKINNQGTYKLKYNTSINGPSVITKNIDHWNYWKPGVNLTPDNLVAGGATIFPNDIKYELNKDYQGNSRSASLTAVTYGMLSEIIYPTGGYSTFYYEPHDYSHLIKRDKSSYFRPHLSAINDKWLAGGVRIGGIETYDNMSNNPVSIKNYYYKNKSEDVLSSGILNHVPIYYKVTDLIGTGILGDNGYLILLDNYYLDASNIGFSPISYENDHVTYNSIIETEIKDAIEHTSETFDLFFYDQKREFSFQMPDLEDVQICIQVVTGAGNFAKAALYGLNGDLIKKIEFNNIISTGIEKFYYKASDFGLRPLEKCKLIIEGSPQSRLIFIMSYYKYNEADKSKIINKFTSYIDYPDNTFPEVYGKLPNDYNSRMSFCLNLDHYDNSNFRGKIKERLYYDFKNRLIQSENFKYHNFSNYTKAVYFKKHVNLVQRHTMYYQVAKEGRHFVTRFANSFAPVFQKNIVFENFTKLKSKTTNEYLYDSYMSIYPTDTLITKEEYTYTNPYNYLETESVQNSQGETVKTSYKYAFQMETAPYLSLKQKSIFSPLVEIEKKVGNQTIAFSRNNYSFKTRLVLDSIQEGRNNGSLRTKYAVKSFDSNGNPNNVVVNGNRNILYEWDGYFLIAKIENPENLQNLSGSYDDLRKNNPGTFITTYTHKSILGLSSMTDPKGIPTYYTYNSKTGLLEKVYSVIGNNKYLYNFYKVNFNE